MNTDCILVGDIKAEFAKIAKIAIDNGIKIKTIENLSDLEKNFSDKEIFVLLTEDVNLDNFIINKNYKIVTFGNKENFKHINNNIFLHFDFPLNKKKLMDFFNNIKLNNSSFICSDIKMKELINICKKVALSNANVLVSGESGTGKEMITRFIHQCSNRSNNSFVALNCAAIPENLLESELFGHEKGAFTGALTQRIGKFEEAHNGTLFLDEISEMNQHLQAKLLRVIQEKEVCRLGSNKLIQINCRIIASTNKDLKHCIQNGSFREDLYYRLNVINISIPPLRERKQDILVLSEYFLKKFCKLNGVEDKVFSDGAIKSLIKYDWPGNVRELENIIHRNVILTQNNIINTIDGIMDVKVNKVV